MRVRAVWQTHPNRNVIRRHVNHSAPAAGLADVGVGRKADSSRGEASRADAQLMHA